MKIFHILVLFSIGLSVDFVTASILKKGFTALTKIFPMLDDFVDLYDEFTDKHDDPLHVNSKEKRLYEAISNITYAMKSVEESIPQVTIAKIKQLERDFSQIIHFEIKLEDLVKQINFIESRYESFLGKCHSRMWNWVRVARNANYIIFDKFFFRFSIAQKFEFE